MKYFGLIQIDLVYLASWEKNTVKEKKNLFKVQPELHFSKFFRLATKQKISGVSLLVKSILTS